MNRKWYSLKFTIFKKAEIVVTLNSQQSDLSKIQAKISLYLEAEIHWVSDGVK